MTFSKKLLLGFLCLGLGVWGVVAPQTLKASTLDNVIDYDYIDNPFYTSYGTISSDVLFTRKLVYYEGQRFNGDFEAYYQALDDLIGGYIELSGSYSYFNTTVYNTVLTIKLTNNNNRRRIEVWDYDEGYMLYSFFIDTPNNSMLVCDNDATDLYCNSIYFYNHGSLSNENYNFITAFLCPVYDYGRVVQYAWNDGIRQGREQGYSEGYEEGESVGFNAGADAGREQGYLLGYNKALEDMPSNWLVSMLEGLNTILNLEIFPNIKLGYFLFVPLAFGILMFILKIGRG